MCPPAFIIPDEVRRYSERGEQTYYGGPALTQIPLTHGADRIERMGEGAVVVGVSGKDLFFTGIALGEQPEPVQRYILTGASQGETRSHGFFYRADGDADGILGLPFRKAGRPGYEHLYEGSAGVVFRANRDRRFRELGLLEAGAGTRRGDRCEASCVDWYGNARPLFVGERVFALLGYELVEGVVRDGRITEIRRVEFQP